MKATRNSAFKEQDALNRMSCQFWMNPINRRMMGIPSLEEMEKWKREGRLRKNNCNQNKLTEPQNRSIVHKKTSGECMAANRKKNIDAGLTWDGKPRKVKRHGITGLKPAEYRTWYYINVYKPKRQLEAKLKKQL